MMQDLYSAGIRKMDSHILFLAKHKELQKVRLFMIQIWPWSGPEEPEYVEDFSTGRRRINSAATLGNFG